MIVIDFEKTNPEGTLTFKDAIYLPDNHTFTEAEMENMKTARFQAWYELVTAFPQVTE